MKQSNNKEKVSLKVLLEVKSKDNEETNKLLAAGYMVLHEETKGFACGNCKFINPKDDYCDNKAIETVVSPNHGCCNHFFPKGEAPKFGKQS